MVRHHRVIRRIARDEDQERFLVLWTATKPVQELHWVRRMHKRGKTRIVTGRHQHACGDTDAFMDVVILLLVTCAGTALALGKNTDQPWRDFHIGLLRVGSAGRERIEPGFIGEAGIEFALFSLGGRADFGFFLR